MKEPSIRDMVPPIKDISEFVAGLPPAQTRYLAVLTPPVLVDFLNEFLPIKWVIRNNEPVWLVILSSNFSEWRLSCSEKTFQRWARKDRKISRNCLSKWGRPSTATRPQRMDRIPYWSHPTRGTEPSSTSLSTLPCYSLIEILMSQTLFRIHHAASVSLEIPFQLTSGGSLNIRSGRNEWAW